MFNLFKKKKKAQEKEKSEKSDIKDLFSELENKLEDNKDTDTKINDLLDQIQIESREKKEESSVQEESADQVQDDLKESTRLQLNINKNEAAPQEGSAKEAPPIEQPIQESSLKANDKIKTNFFSNLSFKKARSSRKIKILDSDTNNEENIQNIIGNTLSRTQLKDINPSHYVSRNSTHIVSQINNQLIQLFKNQDINITPEEIQNKINLFNDKMTSSIIVPLPSIDIPRFQMLIYQVKKLVKEKIPTNRLYNYTIGRKKSSNELIIKVSKKITTREQE